MTNVLTDTVQRTIDGMQPKQVYAEPIERDGVDLPRPRPRCAAAAGGGGDTDGNGGAGFGLTARPAGMYVIRDGNAEWKPALDLNRGSSGGQIVAIVALLVLRSILQAALIDGRDRRALIADRSSIDRPRCRSRSRSGSCRSTTGRSASACSTSDPIARARSTTSSGYPARGQGRWHRHTARAHDRGRSRAGST